MKRALLFCNSLLIGTLALAQCTSAVPSNAIVITSQTGGIITQSNANFWICDGAFQQVFTGTNNNFWVESSAFFNSINGSNCVVRYKGTVALGVFGSNNTIYATSAAAISDQGTGNTINACGANGVVFTYASAPSNGCATVGISEAVAADLRVYYDAATDALMVTSTLVAFEQVRIFDLNGREVLDVRGGSGTPISMVKQTPGMYIAQVITDQGTLIRRFVK